jgi:hypothetical protein
MKVFPFGEGRTDEEVFNFLCNKCLSSFDFEDFEAVGGKERFSEKIRSAVKADLDSNADDICILVFCDVDKDRNREDVVNQFYTIFKKLSPGWDGKCRSHSTYKNIYFFEQAPSEEKRGLCLVLHLADVSGFKLPSEVTKSNNTTDGYILAVGLENNILNRFEKEAGAKIDNVLYDLITKCISKCFSEAGIEFEQDKDYLAAYLCASRFWVKHRTDDEIGLAKTIMGRAWKYNPNHFKEIFVTWIEAMTKAGGS